ncbi:MAG: hypothetical protein MZV64_28890 [Ignavibacteriales bacterium]|nr:hypothetical protein [Ignavibacteriales bacterium]
MPRPCSSPSFTAFSAPAYRAILFASGVVGNAIFLVIATVVFFVLLTPIALVMRCSETVHGPALRPGGRFLF